METNGEGALRARTRMTIEVQFRTIPGDQFVHQVAPGTTVAEMRAMLGAKADETTKFIFRARVFPDDAKIEDFQLGPGSFIIIHKVPRRRELPPAPEPDIDIEIGEPVSTHPGDPPNFGELVQEMLALGFSDEQCRQALRANNYDTNQAAEALFGAGDAVSVAAPATAPAPAPAPRRRYGEMQARYDAMTPQQKRLIDGFADQGQDPETLMEMFDQAGYNEAMLREFLGV